MTRRFAYVALDRTQTLVKGELTSMSPEDVELYLRSRDLHTVHITESKRHWFQRAFVWDRRRFRRMDRKQFGMLIDQINTLYGAGIGLPEVLSALTGSMSHPITRQVLVAWHQALNEGLSFADAISQTAHQIPNADQVIGAIRSGEEAGLLDRTLTRLATSLANEAENQSRLQNALIYPALLVVTSLVAIAYLMMAVVPELVSVFAHRQADLPWTTHTVIAISEGLRHYWWIIVLIAAVLVVGGSFLLQVPAVRMRWDQSILRWPLIGRWFTYHQVARWSDCLSLLLSSHIPVAQALEIANPVCTNRALKRQLNVMRSKIAAGDRFASALESIAELPDLVRLTLQSAEAANQLSPACQKLATFYQNELNHQLRTFIELINPVLLIMISLVIMFIMLSILTPILDMNQLV